MTDNHYRMLVIRQVGLQPQDSFQILRKKTQAAQVDRSVSGQSMHVTNDGSQQWSYCSIPNDW